MLFCCVSDCNRKSIYHRKSPTTVTRENLQEDENLHTKKASKHFGPTHHITSFYAAIRRILKELKFFEIFLNKFPSFFFVSQEHTKIEITIRIYNKSNYLLHYS